MKKIITIALIAVMCLSLAACGVDKQPAQDAVNEVALTYNTIADAMNKDADAYPEEAFTFMNDLSAKLTEYQTALQGDELTEEDLAAIIEWCGPIMERLEQIKEANGIE